MRRRLIFFIFFITDFLSFGLSADIDESKYTIAKPILPKCCSENYNVGAKKKCTVSSDPKLDFSDLPLYDSEVNPTGRVLKQVYGLAKYGSFENKTYRRSLFDHTIMGQNYYMTEEGILYVEIPNELWRWRKLNVSQFCVDYQLPVLRRNILKPTPSFWIVMPEDEELVRDDPYIAAGFLVSCAFLFLVLVVYGLLPELRNLGGLILMAYVATLFASFFYLAMFQLARHSPVMCLILSYKTYFFLLSSFCWMNVMSYDIWWTFRGYAKARPIHRRGERFKFAMYCAYACGLPLVMTIVFIVLNHVNLRHVPWLVTPNIPTRGCFLGVDAKLVYLYVPMLILIVCNWAFFLMTVFNIWRLHRSTNVLDSSAAGTPAAHRKQKYRLLIYLKLSIIMGINWVLEVVSSFKPHLTVWVFTDAYNILIGLSIFLIFVCKKKIFKRVLEELGISRKLRPSRYSKSQSSNTTDSEISQDTPLQVCPNPKGSMPVIYEKRYQ